MHFSNVSKMRKQNDEAAMTCVDCVFYAPDTTNFKYCRGTNPPDKENSCATGKRGERKLEKIKSENQDGDDRV